MIIIGHELVRLSKFGFIKRIHSWCAKQYVDEPMPGTTEQPEHTTNCMLPRLNGTKLKVQLTSRIETTIKGSLGVDGNSKNVFISIIPIILMHLFLTLYRSLSNSTYTLPRKCASWLRQTRNCVIGPNFSSSGSTSSKNSRNNFCRSLSSNSSISLL